MEKKKNLEWLNCSERDLDDHLKVWLGQTDLKDSILFLEGEMGAGKSTFVRSILKVLSPESVSKGSPTFPLVQTYPMKNGLCFYHIDLYRLKNDGELEESGIESQIDESDTVVCVEWASLFPAAFSHWFDPKLPKRKAVYLVRIGAGETADHRNYEITAY